MEAPVRHTNENAEQAEGQVHSGGLKKESRLQTRGGGSSVDKWYLEPRLDAVTKGVSVERKGKSPRCLGFRPNV